MNLSTHERLFGWRHAFDSPVTLWATGLIAAVLIVSLLATKALRAAGKIPEEQHREIMLRWTSWLWLVAIMVGPILLGSFWTILAATFLSLLCYREYARATGLFREKTISVVIVIGILLTAFASLDHYDRLFFCLAPLTTAMIAISTIPLDKPKGYIQRVALGALGYLMFGYALGYLGLISTDENYRPILLMILITVELNDVFAYCFGKTFKGPKLIVNTSPNKTISGALGAAISTTLLTAWMAHYVFLGSRFDRIGWLILLGFLVSVLGQLGDLVVSSIKRDLGVKDIGKSIPGHGGVLDRFDSLLLVPPAVYHLLSIILGPLGSHQAARIITGGS